MPNRLQYIQKSEKLKEKAEQMSGETLQIQMVTNIKTLEWHMRKYLLEEWHSSLQ